jgi:cytochrome oxidase Cu insertion factor (SCO1/SenC/PrrC family)
MAMQETESVRQNDPARTLIRLSAVLTVIMSVMAGVLIWQSRNNAATPVGKSDDAGTPTDGDMPAYSFKVIPPKTKRGTEPTGMADVIANFELTERSGRKVTNKDLLGKPWVVSFIFINCAGPCTRVTGQIKLLQDRFAGKPVRLVTITVDPERDTPDRLANYADNFGAESEWLFLTKDQQTIYPLIRDSFGLTVQEETGATRKKGWEITHSTRVVHIDAAGRIRGKYDALDAVEMAQLVREVNKEIAGLPKDASINPSAIETDSPVEAPIPDLSPIEEGT